MEKKNKEREDEKEAKDPYLNVKFSEPSMSQLFSLPRPKVFIKSRLPTGCVLKSIFTQVTFIQALLTCKSSFDF